MIDGRRWRLADAAELEDWRASRPAVRTAVAVLRTAAVGVALTAPLMACNPASSSPTDTPPPTGDTAPSTDTDTGTP